MNRVEELLEAIERRKKSQEVARPLFDPNILTPQQVVLTETSDGPGIERLCDVQPTFARLGAWNN